MEIKTITIPLRELADEFHELPEGGRVTAWSGRLSVRPEYQREFIYDPKRQRLVVDSVLHGYPLGSMYFTPPETPGDSEFEVLDGQQRIISLCRFTHGAFSIPWGQGADQREFFYENLPEADRQRFDSYPMRVYVCEGDDGEKMSWFRRINVAGMVLTDQELRNATYHGPWVSDARRMFARVNSPAGRHFGTYLKGVAIRQDWLETALDWWSLALHVRGVDDASRIDHCMSLHRDDPDAHPLFEYMETVFDWVEKTFPEYNTYMKGLDWGPLYERFHRAVLDPEGLKHRIQQLLDDDEVTRKPGIWEYVLDDDATHLSLRQFDRKTARAQYDRQTKWAHEHELSNCPLCRETDGDDRNRIWEFQQMEADHKTPWSRGGKTVPDNCEMLCKKHNRAKSNL